MQITIELPEEIGQQLQIEWGDLSRRALEALAVKAYQDGVMTPAEIQQLLHLPSRWDTEEFLKRSRAYLDYTEEDLAEDVNTIENLLSR